MCEKKDINVYSGLALLKQYTAARIALGRTGVSVPVNELLQFKMAHAHARDAVYSLLDKNHLQEEADNLNLAYCWLKSKATDRQVYLQRPDWGRQLDEASALQLKSLPAYPYDVCISIADGLSATAVNHHAMPVVRWLLSWLATAKLSIAPLCFVEQGRVAIADEIGSLLHAKLSLILIGERPGLSSPDSMGAYLTFAPTVGLTDELRNCVSNIRPEGLHYAAAAEKIAYLIREAFRLQLTGVFLKDNSSTDLLPGE